MSGLGADRELGEPGRFGGLLRAWRTTRGQSQLALSVNTGVSSRHLSYLETGRAKPSREMVHKLALALEIPLRDRNALLESAGFAAIYRETPLDAHAMGPIREAIQLLLRATEPNPTFVVNRRYDVLDANSSGWWLLATFTGELARFSKPYNFGKLLVSANGIRPHLENWQDVARKVLGRLRRDVGGAHSRDPVDEALMKEIAPTLVELGEPSSPTEALPLMVPVRFRRDSLALHLFTTIATLGTPLDVTLQEIRIETLFPTDAESKHVLTSRSSAS